VADPEPTPIPRARRHLGGGAAVSVIADLGPLAAAGVLSIVLARVIGPSGNGEYALLATVVNVAVLVCSLGLSSGITYEVSRANWAVRRAFHESYLVALLLGALGIAGGLGFYALTQDSVLRSVDLALVLVALASIPAFLAGQFASAILLGDDRYEAYGSLPLTTAAVTVVVAAGLTIPYGLTGAIVGMLAAAVVTATVGAALLGRRSPGEAAQGRRVEPAAPRRPLRDAFRFGLPGWIGNIFQQANYRFDVIILGAYASTTDVGVYSVALTLVSIAWVLPHGLQMVIFPRTASLDAGTRTGEVSPEESDAAVTRGTRHSVLLLPPAGLIVVALLALVPLVYGGRFDQTVVLGLVLLPGVLALGVGKVLGSVVAGRGKPRYNLYTGALSAVITLGLYFALIPPYGDWGAAIASSISYLTTTVIACVFFKRVVGVPLRDALIPTTADLRNYPEALHALRAHLRGRRARQRPA
jgi:O-antigen/teichoic acid export membrane protein